MTSPENLNRARYLAIRQNVQNIVALMKETDVEGMLASARAALASGPAKSPEFWKEGAPALVADIALAEALIKAKAVVP